MEIAEVEVHRRPRGNDDDGGNSSDELPPISIGSARQHTTGEEINPLSPRSTYNASSSTAVEGGGYANAVAADDDEEELPRQVPRPSEHSEIEIEPAGIIYIHNYIIIIDAGRMDRPVDGSTIPTEPSQTSFLT
ncbi:hypothetical protein Q1695_005005 [Nippostrongylus brasiliensis]|nr:hypothetical protein Q1695_005005 [Nippostrongylus brasiliensis]